MNKKGALVLRDMVFMMMIVSSIFILSGIFVSDMANNYDNTDMSSEWDITGTNVLANSTFYDVSDDVLKTGAGLSKNSTGIYSLVSGLLDGVGSAMFMVLTAPNTIGNLVGATLQDMELGSANTFGSASYIIANLIKIILWAIIIFTVASAFLRGGKL